MYAAIWTYKCHCKLSYECVTDQEQDMMFLNEAVSGTSTKKSLYLVSIIFGRYLNGNEHYIYFP